MARHYEYIIHGPPVSPGIHVPKRHKTLSPMHNRDDSNLRILYRNSSSSSDHVQSPGLPVEHRISSPTTPKLPPTPPIAGDAETAVGGVIIRVEDDGASPESTPVTPVLQNSPPTPDYTPPKEVVKLPPRPLLVLRPSMASTHAESFRTAREDMFADDEPPQPSPAPVTVIALPTPSPDVPRLSGESRLTDISPQVTETKIVDGHDAHANRPSSPSYTLLQNPRSSRPAVAQLEDTPRAQLVPDHSTQQLPPSQVGPVVGTKKEYPANHDTLVMRLTMHEQVEEPIQKTFKRGPSLRDRLEETKQVQSSASTERFASIIGWNDGVRPAIHHENVTSTNRWSVASNLSAVEAYVVDSPIKPQKRGTLRKVVKNDSLRSASSPLPDSKRTSLQSTSDSPHRLIHKKQKLHDQNRWSAGSEFSKRSSSLCSPPSAVKTEVIQVAVIPERRSSLHTSRNSSRRNSRSISDSSGKGLSSMPPVTMAQPRRKRAFSDCKERSPSQSGRPQVPVRSSSLSAPTSRSVSRANSMTSDDFSAQRQAERDLRSTLDRMESERLLAGLRLPSDQSTPTPAAKKELFPDTTTGRETSHSNESTLSARRPVAIDLSGIVPGTKEWADLRPSELTGTPFSQPSNLSASPEIVEAKAVNFFPRNKNSLQLIEPFRLSESQTVGTHEAQHTPRSTITPSIQINTPRVSDFAMTAEQFFVDSPLRNPRKPPEPPQFKVIPPTPLEELDHQLGVTPDTSPVKSRTRASATHQRPSLQGRDRSESFIKTLSRGLSLRNARNPKAGEELDSTLHPFWRPRAFWDDDEYAERVRREREREVAPSYQSTTRGNTTNNVNNTERTIIAHPRVLRRSNSIKTGPISLMRHISEKRRQQKIVNDHLEKQQMLARQSSYSSLQKFDAGRRLYAFPGRTLSLNVGLDRLKGLQDRMLSMRARREDEKREKRREALRKSIGTEVVMQSDSRFWNGGTTGGNGVNETDLEHARAESLVGKRGLRL